MREIEYRAWNVKEKIMCYDNEDNSSSYWDGVKSSFIGLVNCNFQYYSNNNTYIFMQWTGLYDKNKKKIYEGDKVKINGGYNNRGVICNVVFNDSCFDVVGDLFRDYLKVYVANHSIEVIGNIYENEN